MSAATGARPVSPLVDVVANGVLFNISWFVIVLAQSAAIGALAACVHLAVHFYFLGRGLPEWRLVAWVTAVGLVLDQLLFQARLFTVAGQAGAAPLWLGCLWPVFATTLTHAFHGLRDRVGLAVVLGAVGGTTSYLAGARLTAVDFGDPLLGPAILAVLWALLFPSFLRLASRLVPDDPAGGQ